MKKIFKAFLLFLLIVLVLFQLYPRSNNNTGLQKTSSDIIFHHTVPESVLQILEKSCYDCHSNHTDYPWYAQIQPVSLWLADHIKEGKAELNFSEFGNYSLRRQYRKLEEINEQVEHNEMPLSSYTLIHRDARLDDQQKLLVSSWTKALSDSFEKNYPIDSLRRKR